MQLDDKKQILEDEYAIPMTRELETEVSSMCNLSRGIREDGRMEGRKEGIGIGAMNKASQMAVKMLQKNRPASDILEFTELTLEQLCDIAKQNGLTVEQIQN